MGGARQRRGLFEDWNAVWIKRAGQRRAVTAIADARNLRCGEDDDPDRRVIAVRDIEIMEVSPRRAENHGICASNRICRHQSVMPQYIERK
jgi:hypothetical protein